MRRAIGLQIAERGGDDETSMLGAQVGYSNDLFFANVAYQDFQKIQGYNPCFGGNCNGNTVDASGNLVNDYNLLQVRGGVKLAGVNLFASWAQNGEADDEDTAYSFGVNYGKVKDPGHGPSAPFTRTSRKTRSMAACSMARSPADGRLTTVMS